MVDFHSHILPFVDDGAESYETSISMINLSKRQGVTTILATPHFVPANMTVETSLKKRTESLEGLFKYASEKDFKLPQIIPGFEVAVDSKLKDLDISKLCLGNGKVILLEMPYGNWTEEHFETLEFIKESGYMIILAHVERYIGVVPDEMFERIINMGFCNQVNSNAFIKPEIRDIIASMIKEGFVHLIGSDAHNMIKRCSLFDVAFNFIKTKIGPEEYNTILNNQDYVLSLIR